MNEAAAKFRKSLAVAGAVAIATTATTSCSRNIEKSLNQTNNNDNNIGEKSPFPTFHNNSNYFEKDEIHMNYLYISNKLKAKDSLSNKEILEISNIYKKLFNSIDYINSFSEDPNKHILDELPKMNGLYTDIKTDLVELLDENNLLLLPYNSFDFQRKGIIEHYLTYTESTPLEEIKIINLNDNNTYYILSNNEFLFKIYIATDEDGTLSITPNIDDTNLSKKDINILASKSTPITETKTTIPSIDVSELTVDFDR